MVQPAIFAAISKKDPKEFINYLPFWHLKKYWQLQKDIEKYKKKGLRKKSRPRLGIHLARYRN